MDIEIIDEDTGLERKRYTFYLKKDFASAELLLDGYFEESRPSKRHKWRCDACWTRLRIPRGGADYSSRGLDKPDVYEIGYLFEEALDMVRYRIKLECDQ